MNRTALATVTGLILGLALVFGNFGDMLIVALLGAIGYGIAKDTFHMVCPFSVGFWSWEPALRERDKNRLLHVPRSPELQPNRPWPQAIDDPRRARR